MPPSRASLLILAKYAVFGVIPLVDPEHPRRFRRCRSQQIPQQQGTDYAYIKTLARGGGLRLLPRARPAAGTSHAYWGPEIRVGVPQPALTIEHGRADNVEQLTFSFDKRDEDACRSCSSRSRRAKVPIRIPIPTSRR